MKYYLTIGHFYYSPIKIYEYLAAGKAVLTSRVGQIKEIIQDNENGMLFETNNFDERKVKCFQLIENQTLRVKLGKQPRNLSKNRGHGRGGWINSIRLLFPWKDT